MTPLTEAEFIYRNRATLTPTALHEAAISLAEHGIFSARGIARITGLSVRKVLSLAPKSTRAGGRLDPEALSDLVELVGVRDRGEMDVFLAQRVLAGCSATYAERLTGIPKSTLTRWADKAAAL